MSGMFSQLRKTRSMVVLLAMETAVMVPFALVQPLAWLMIVGLVIPTWVLAFTEARRIAKLEVGA